MFGCISAYLKPLSVTLQKYGNLVRTMIFDSQVIGLHGCQSLLHYDHAKKHRELEQCFSSCQSLHHLEVYGDNHTEATKACWKNRKRKEHVRMMIAKQAGD